MDHMQAALFDMDGTIIDSEPYWMTAERELVESFGGTWSEEQGYALVGSGLWNSASLLKAAGVDLELDDIVHRLSDRVLAQIEDAVPWRPGVRELFQGLLEADIPCALVTMSLRKNAVALAHAVEKELGKPVFQAIVAGDDVEAPKPNPEAYLKGASALGVDIQAAVALEDSAFGAASAFSAGAITIGIPLHVGIPHNSVHEMWSSLEGKTVGDLHAVWRTHRRQDAS
ncbi:MAG: HAD family phosphatase [Pontimonas sp.]|jgi:HAD superfamily hydrolase (TIGR01509 family)|nr:HAD family phosphatase [Pontimonas sp.]